MSEILAVVAGVWFAGAILAVAAALPLSYPDDPSENMLRALWWPLIVVRLIVMGLRLTLKGLWLELRQWKP